MLLKILNEFDIIEGKENAIIYIFFIINYQNHVEIDLLMKFNGNN